MKKKKVLAINSSKRKKNTYNVLVKMCDLLNQKGFDTEIINLFDYDIKPCYGCETCLKKDFCPIKDDVETIMKKLIEADGIIISTPVYMASLSGKLKNFIDRTCKWFHRPELVGKPCFVISTTMGSGLKNTIKYLNNVIVQWGAMPCGSIGRTVRTLNEPVSDKEINNFVVHMCQDIALYKPAINQIIMFQVQKVLANKILITDREYWKTKNWLNNKDYFYVCKINVIKKGIGRIMYKILDKSVKKQ